MVVNLYKVTDFCGTEAELKISCATKKNGLIIPFFLQPAAIKSVIKSKAFLKVGSLISNSSLIFSESFLLVVG